MGIRLVYGLKTDDLSYLREFYPSRRIAASAEAMGLDYGALLFSPGSPLEPVRAACQGQLALLRGELPIELYESLESFGIRVINNAAATALAKDKFRSASFFSALGLAHPRTLLFSLHADASGATASHDDPIGTQDPKDERSSPPLSLPMPLPFVAKPRCGKMGRGVALIDSHEAWLAYVRGRSIQGSGSRAAERADEFIAQEYAASSRGRDIRFFFASWPGDTPWICVQRQNEGFLSNAHAGGKMGYYEPPAALAAAAERAFNASGLAYGSVDFLFADEVGSSFYICEMNACPGFEELERACGVDAASAIVRAALANAEKAPARRAASLPGL